MANLDLSKYGITDVKEILHNRCKRNDWYLHWSFT